MLSFAIPGTVIGVSYIVAFNVPPIEITGTGLILVLCFVFRNMPVGVRAGIAALAQIDKSLDEASMTLGARTATTVRRVVLPLLRPALVATLVFSFVHAMTAVSAIIFLVTAQYNMATAYIVGRVEAVNLFDLEQRLSRMGLDLISGAPTSQKSRLVAGARIPRQDLINFCFHMEQLSGAGVPIVEGLIDLRESVENLRFREVVGGLVETIEGGKSLSAAMAEIGRAHV